MTSGKQIKIGGMLSYAMIVINVLLGLIYTPWILKEIGSSNYGLYTLASSLIALFLMDFGMSAAVSRFISNYRAKNEIDNINAFVIVSVKFYSVICCVLFIVLTIVYFNLNTIYKNLTPTELSDFRGVFIITAFFVVVCFPVNVCNGVLNAFEQYILLKLSDVLNKVGTVIVTIIVLCNHGGVFALVFINGLFNLITFIAKIIIVKKKTTVQIKNKSNIRISIREVFSFSAWSTVSSLSQQLLFNCIPSILAMVANTLSITLYGFANVIEGYVYTITQAINGLFMPSVSREIAKETDAAKVLPLLIKVGRLNQTVVSLLLIGLTILGKEFVNLWVGEEYASLYVCILLLSYPYIVSSSQQIANTSIVVLNKIKYPAIIGIFVGGINIIAAYLICPRFGVVGVCAVIGATSVLRIVLLNFVYYFVLKINIRNFFVECQLKMLPSFLIAFAVGYFLCRFIPSQQIGLIGWGYFGIKVLIVSGVYFCTMWLIGWNRYEKGLIKSFVPQIRR